ncbi:MAG: rane fusion protein multidrug efflux system [Acidobacteriota bacterium]|jgi:multidrug efflux system membrane fusion protein|nr:rane fusion protein multidrug efflux system [Acidobacteriota bacterium]
MRNKLLLFASIAVVPFALACSKGDAAAKQGGPGGPGASRKSMEFPVEVRAVESRNVEYSINAVGSLDAFERVAVTARAAGAIERVMFTEGQLVSKGQALAEIEPERYRIVVDAAEASLSKARAGLGEAEAGYARRQAASAKNPGLIRGEEVETWRTKVQSTAAEVTQAQAALAQAKLNLRDAFVRAPVGGIIQTRTVETGQYVPVGTVLATLVRRDPLLLRFQVPEQESSPLRPGIIARFNVGEDEVKHEARITHVAAAATQSSRMVDVTAHVLNANDPALRPGAFARVTIPIGSTRLAPVIPQTAIRPSEKGFLAFTVSNGVAQQRVLKLGMRTADGQVEVREGLQAGETLVVRGAEALRDGAKVRVSK